MCGIAGYCSRDHNEDLQPALKRAVARLEHRGPNGSGCHFAEGIGLGHTRLAIIDLSTGDQPLFNEDDSLAVVVNGEFYNYRGLQESLTQKGHRFKTRSDSETLLHLYEDRPFSEALGQLNGMWALALWDSRKKWLFLSRDRAGKKPLYYAQVKDRLYFASEIKALLEFPDVDRSINRTALALYLKYGYVPAPYSIYRGIHKLPAASFALFENGRLSIEYYWAPPEAWDTRRREEDWLEELGATLDDAVRLRLVSDVPLGAFLSGGLDSSLIVSRMVHHIRGRTKSFSIGFTDREYDESRQARMVAGRLGTEHSLQTIDVHDMEMLPRLAAHFDEPFADASFLPTWHLCRVTREKGTVALSGDGADELFAGYRRYMAGQLSRIYLSIPKNMRRFFLESLLNRLPAPDGYYGRSWRKKAKLFVKASNRFEKNPAALAPQSFDDMQIERLFPGLDHPGLDSDPVEKCASRFHGTGIVNAMLRTDLETYLPDDILVKVDRMSMFHALEVRCPFLDHRLIELAVQMPLKFKIKKQKSKHILRRLAEKQLPAQTIRRGKQGFMVPLDIWFRGALKSYLYDLINDPASLWSIAEARKLFEEHLGRRQDHAQQLWTLAVLGLWAQK